MFALGREMADYALLNFKCSPVFANKQKCSLFACVDVRALFCGAVRGEEAEGGRRIRRGIRFQIVNNRKPSPSAAEPVRGKRDVRVSTRAQAAGKFGSISRRPSLGQLAAPSEATARLRKFDLKAIDAALDHLGLA